MRVWTRTRQAGMAAMLAVAMLGVAMLGSAPAATAPAVSAPRVDSSGPPSPAPPPARSQEIRALWVLRGSLTQPALIDRLVASAARSGFNTLLLQVRGRGDAFYDSTIEPRGAGVAGTFDPLAYAITAAGKHGLRVHVWFNTNLVASTAMMPTSRNHVVRAHPEWLMVPRPIAADLARLGPRDPRYVARLVEWTKRNAAGVEGLYASPVTPEAAQYVERVVSDIVTRYPVSGVHLDYIRYPSNLFDHSQGALLAFRDSLQRELSPSDRQRLDDQLRRDPLAYADAYPDRWAAFRRMRLADLVARIRGAVHRSRPDALVTAAVIPDAREAFEHKMQDWPDWARRGLIDAFCPMAYTTSLATFNRQVAAARQAAAPRAVWAGIGAYRLTPAQTIDHIAAARSAGAAGVVLFSYDSLVESPARDPLGAIGRVAFAPTRASADRTRPDARPLADAR
ncbi:MAG: family 10 glycosylhydrolase [Vicinamibacteraceae bacterium]